MATLILYHPGRPNQGDLRKDKVPDLKQGGVAVLLFNVRRHKPGPLGLRSVETRHMEGYQRAEAK